MVGERHRLGVSGRSRWWRGVPVRGAPSRLCGDGGSGPGVGGEAEFGQAAEVEGCGPSPTRTAPDSEAQTRTPTACYDTAFARAPACPVGTPRNSTPSPGRSTPAPARRSAGEPPQNPPVRRARRDTFRVPRQCCGSAGDLTHLDGRCHRRRQHDRVRRARHRTRRRSGPRRDRWSSQQATCTGKAVSQTRTETLGRSVFGPLPTESEPARASGSLAVEAARHRAHAMEDDGLHAHPHRRRRPARPHLPGPR